MGHGHGDSVMLSEGSTLLASFPLNWLETTILIVAWTALVVDVMRQQWISRVSKIAWIVFIILVPIVSWIAYGIVRHRHGVGPASHT
jgi:Phospholipase_D-nuclease N-terminal